MQSEWGAYTSLHCVIFGRGVNYWGWVVGIVHLAAGIWVQRAFLPTDGHSDVAESDETTFLQATLKSLNLNRFNSAWFFLKRQIAEFLQLACDWVNIYNIIYIFLFFAHFLHFVLHFVLHFYKLQYFFYTTWLTVINYTNDKHTCCTFYRETHKVAEYD